MRDLDDPQKHAGPVAMPRHADREWKSGTLCDVAASSDRGLSPRARWRCSPQRLPALGELPEVYGGIRPRVNVRSLLSGLETDRWNG